MSKNANLSIAKKYAEGLAKALGEDSKKMESIGYELDLLKQWMSTQKDLETLLLAPNIPLQKKNALLDNLFYACQALEEVKTFCKLLLKNGRFSLFPMILDFFENLVLKSQGKVKAFVATATALIPEEIEVLRKKLEAYFGKKIQMVFQEDKNILGGVVVRVEDEIFDGSLRKQLEKLKIVLSKGV
jgi:F-type H+-transporting ATPase subunit delta